MKRQRYKVATCTGWPIGPRISAGRWKPGCSASVLDTLRAHREVKRFRSEDRLPTRGDVRRGVEGAKRAAQEYADKLNAECERT